MNNYNSSDYLDNPIRSLSPKIKKRSSKPDSLYSATPELPHISVDHYGTLSSLQHNISHKSRQHNFRTYDSPAKIYKNSINGGRNSDSGHPALCKNRKSGLSFNISISQNIQGSPQHSTDKLYQRTPWKFNIDKTIQKNMDNIRSFVKQRRNQPQGQGKCFKLSIIYLPHKASEPFYLP